MSIRFLSRRGPLGSAFACAIVLFLAGCGGSGYALQPFRMNNGVAVDAGGGDVDRDGRIDIVANRGAESLQVSTFRQRADRPGSFLPWTELR